MVIIKKYIISIVICMMLFTLGCAALKIIKDRLPAPHSIEGGILFQYDDVSASRVDLAGEFNEWKYGNDEKAIHLDQDETGIWRVVHFLPPGRYKYKFVIDDSNWQKDPNGEDANDTDGNSIIVVR